MTDEIKRHFLFAHGNTRFSFSGAEDVFRFTGNETHTDYFRLMLRDGNYLLVGGR